MRNHLIVTLDTLRQAHHANPLPDWAVRRARLKALRCLVIEQGTALAEAIDADFQGRAAEETQLLELVPTLTGIDHALKHGRRWMRTQHGRASRWFWPARTEQRPRPKGVVGILVPWNYPLYLALGPLTDALAAGNRVMLKLSEHTPRTSALLARLLPEYLKDGSVAVVEGDAEVARAFAALAFDHLLFTGSTRVGHAVMKAAAEHLVPVTLELGGKSPALIAPDADFERAVERIVYGKSVNAGQTCIAPDYVLLPRDRVEDFIAAARRAFGHLYPRFAENEQYSAIINDGHLQRLMKLRAEAEAGGARSHPLARVGRGRRMPLTVLSEVEPGSALMREEIFGPLLPLVPYDHLDEAIDYIRARPHPLALYVFTSRRDSLERVLSTCSAGGVTVNDTLFHIAQHSLPFGGVGASGMGAYHGRAGFETFSHTLPILRQSRRTGTALLRPPYGRGFSVMRRLLLR
ncbi:coniferyl aldehyde dehydrogenase [Oleiagrimonas sp. C23AA]|uniref:coniferyl aldehyde dehydrogenase n=1 Tax=Oleiagrimonas sp. C23AA TaxID=2719047 RepID=UPI00141DE0A9|nr:coniferyl aldehyde dehydrogenase [Oleiagrimonas sp. C23AA]NII10676.1 coniferyl aldehyde dehydrogenase [Oleiagrimonas sp. C23AA]